MDSIGVIIFIAIIAIVAVIIIFWIIKGLSSGRKKLKLPKGHEMKDQNENSWSNNAIRKQGKEGKGIR